MIFKTFLIAVFFTLVESQDTSEKGSVIKQVPFSNNPGFDITMFSLPYEVNNLQMRFNQNTILMYLYSNNVYAVLMCLYSTDVTVQY